MGYGARRADFQSVGVYCCNERSPIRGKGSQVSLKKHLETQAILAFAIVSICLICTVGCAHQASNEQLIAVGWVQAAGEIFIYAHKSDLGKLYDGSCISGVMTRGRKMPEKFNGHLVSVYGKLMDEEDLRGFTLRGISIGVENYCNSPKIAIITRIVAESSER